MFSWSALQAMRPAASGARGRPPQTGMLHLRPALAADILRIAVLIASPALRLFPPQWLKP